MKFTKFMVLAAGIVGLISFFLPLVKSPTESATAMDFVKGFQKASEVADQMVDSGDADVRSAGHELGKLADQVKGFVAMMYAPFLLFLIIGGIATARRRFGRLGGVGVLLFGLVAAALSGLLLAASADVQGTSAGIGLWLTVLSAAAGTLAGLLTLISPDRG